MRSMLSSVHEIGRNHASAADRVSPMGKPVVILMPDTTAPLVLPITYASMKTIATAKESNATDTEQDEQWITGSGLFSGSGLSGSKR